MRSTRSGLVGHETFCAVLDWLGTPIAPSEAVEAAFRGHIRRMVFDGAGQLVDFGLTRRFFTGTLRHAALLRDRWKSDTIPTAA